MPEAETEGFFSGVAGSIKSHLDDRLKSPFAGAFVLSWVACNWQALLLLAFSESSIEERIKVLLSEHFSTWNTVWLPLLLAATIAIAFYVLSAGFYVLLQGYQSLQLQIDRWFDSKAKWLPPHRVIAQKRKFREQIAALEGMASDNANQVDEANARAAEANQKAIDFQNEIAERSNQIGRLSQELAEMKERLLLERGRLKEATAQIERLRQAEERLKNRLEHTESSLLKAADKALKEAEGKNSWSVLSDWIRNANLQSVSVPGGDVRTTGSPPVTLDNLERYLAAKFPGMVVDRALLGVIFKDIISSGLSEQLPTVDAIDAVMRKAHTAVAAYSERNPGYFRKASDYLSKSLGFVFPEFRQTHRFASETRKAFSEFEHLLED